MLYIQKRRGKAPHENQRRPADPNAVMTPCYPKWYDSSKANPLTLVGSNVQTAPYIKQVPHLKLRLLNEPRLLLPSTIMNRMYQVDNDVVLLDTDAVEVLPYSMCQLFLRLTLLPFPARHCR